MNVEETIRVALINYPSIFPNALTVYNHLFCTIGNGYDWKNGELVSTGWYSTDLRAAILREVGSVFSVLITNLQPPLDVYRRSIEAIKSETIKKHQSYF